MQPRKTKIICTIGPASSNLENLKRLIEAGMDTARLNCSHSNHETQKEIIGNIRKASRETGKQIAVLLDLQGPKIRTGMVEGGCVQLLDGEEFIITCDDIEIGNSKIVSTSYKSLPKEVSPGNTILLDDGYLILSVERVEKNNIHTKVIKGGNLKNKKGIITPGVSSSAPSLSEKDFDDLKFGLNAGVDVVALSFVRSEKDIIELKTAMKIFGRSVPVIAKIERYEACEDIEDIIEYSDAIMIARGDLGLEMLAEQVPILQKEIIKSCNFHGKPVIVATQMLESMIENPRPTRAEASDVANAVIDGTDCVMLSGETSVGKFPFDAVSYMDRIIRTVESKYGSQQREYETPKNGAYNLSDAIGRASCQIAEQIGATAIIPFTTSGYSARYIAKYRPSIPIVPLTENEDTLRQLSFVWGVTPVKLPDEIDKDNVFHKLGDYLKNLKFIQSGNYVVFVAGLSAAHLMNENMIKVYQV
ncbi:MAG: pyk [Ignavibacteria bacterium]|nr:pyk [Ignavibacteria bacterium]